MDGGDVDMDTEGKTNAFNIDTEFLETRREQCTLASTLCDDTYPDAACRHYSQASISYIRPDRVVHDRSRAKRSRHPHSTSGTCFLLSQSLLISPVREQFTAIIEAPIFLQLSPHESETSPLRTNGEIPVRIFESALGANDDLNIGGDAITTTRGFQFIELKYTVETGEAERIAVDGAAKAGDEDGSGGSACKEDFFSCVLIFVTLTLARFSGYKLDDTEECGSNVARAYASLVDVYCRSHQW